MRNRSIRAAAALTLICSASASAQDVLVFDGPIPDPQAAALDSIVADEIVVELHSPAARVVEQVGNPLAGLTNIKTLDAIGAPIGVRQMRKQFVGADPQAAAQRGLPDLSGYYVVTFNPALTTPRQAVAAYLASPHVKTAEIIGIHPVSATPNDGNYPTQWHLNQASDRDIDAPEAWNLETGDPSIIVAVLDTGVRYYHKDLGGSAASSTTPEAADGNMWINLLEKNGTAGVDDDANGFVDDWIGYDFVTGLTGCTAGEDCSTLDNDPRDFQGHGTHCAGIVAALNNNGYAVASPSGGWGTGVNQPSGDGVSVMALRIGWATPSGGFVRMDFAASAFYYAAANGARIASCSWGSSNSGGMAAAVNAFIASGGLIFKAAGNANSQFADYLCSRPDVYSVAATSSTDAKASFSSYGTWVDISAPGVSIRSTYHVSSDPNGDYVASLSGTSMATPLVASVAAAVWSTQPSMTRLEVWDRVRTTADNIDAQNPSFIGLLGSGRVNLFNAVNFDGCFTSAQCDDGDPCNGAELCVSGVCQPGTITDCNGNAIADSCDISAGTSLDCNANGVPDECEVHPCGTGPTLLLSFTAATTLPTIGTVQDEDISQYNTATGAWSVYFDGSDVGLTSFAVDALAVLPTGELLISLNNAGTITGIATDDSDILMFTPTSLGTTTAGTWSVYFDGSDVGLTNDDEDIDALDLAPDGRLVISTTGLPTVTGLTGLQDEDLIIFTAATLGLTTSGTWDYYFDGSDVGLSTSNNEDVDGLSILSNGLISLSTLASFSVTGLSGFDEDVFDFSPAQLGTITSGTFSAFFIGHSEGIATNANVGAVEELE